VRSALELAADLGHERVLVIQDPTIGLRAVVAIHSTALGPGVGGTRMRSYPSFDDAVRDALRLSRAMTYKVGFAGMPYGGAKAVIDADSSRVDRRELLAAYARATRELEGRFVSAGDIGVGEDDVHYLAGLSPVFGRPATESAPGISELTALGVFAGVRALAGLLGRKLAALHVAVQGAGEIGSRLVAMLAAEGARLTVADTVAERARSAAAATGARVVAADEIVGTECDLFSPNAVGDVIDSQSIDSLRCAAICGAANNPVADAGLGDELHRRGVLYAPDFVVSAGGVLTLLFERGDLDLRGTTARVERIGSDLSELLTDAEGEGLPPFRLAERRVEERLAAARAGSA
jgi:leucine dehydrogenase